MSETWRIVFMGTPDFAGPALEMLADSEDAIAAVITQPDQPRGRGRLVTPSPVKLLALEKNLPVWQPAKVNAPEIIEKISALRPDAFVVVAYGQILSPGLLALPRIGSLNIHASLLPAYRGPAPINWAIINGEPETGVTTMFQDQGVDTGPILISRAIPIAKTATAGTLQKELAVIGANLLMETIKGLKNGSIIPRPQPEEQAGYAPLLKKSDGQVNWTLPADELDRRIRGLDPWPGAHTSFQNKTLKLFDSRAIDLDGRPGQVLGLENGRILVAAGQGGVALAELQLAGQKRMAAADFWRGRKLSSSTLFGQ